VAILGFVNGDIEMNAIGEDVSPQAHLQDPDAAFQVR
jgi:hypothetical protein